MPDRPTAVTPTRCYACLIGECPHWPHTWGTAADFEEAVANGEPEPGDCECPCGRWTPAQEAFMRPQIVKLLEGAEERRLLPSKPDDLDEILRRLAEYKTAKEDADERP